MVAEPIDTEEARRREIMLTSLRVELTLQARDLSLTLGNVDLPNNRLSGIANGFTWHTQRSTPETRLEYGIEEISRLQKRLDRNSSEYGIYAWLLNQLGKDLRPNKTERELLNALLVEAHQEEEWLARMRLIRAQNLVQILGLLTRAKPFTAELNKIGGALKWY